MSEVKNIESVKKKGCGSRKKVVKVKIAVSRSKYFTGNGTSQSQCTNRINDVEF